MSDHLSSLVARADHNLYGYSPSFAAAIVVGIAFLLLFLTHLYFAIRLRAKFMIPFLVGTLMEALGYFVRRASAGNPTKMGAYIGQSFFIILAPAFLAASVYMVYGRVIAYVGERHSPVRSSKVTKLFVGFDVLLIWVQGAGGGLSAIGSTNALLGKLAKAVLIVGFVVQIMSFGVFGVIAGVYHRRALRAGEPSGSWTKCLWTLYLAVALIFLRNTYRTVEYASSSSYNTGFLLNHEGIYYALEAVPVLLACLVFLASHPARYLPESKDVRLNPDAPAAPLVGPQAYELGQQASDEFARKESWRTAVHSVGYKA